MKKVIREPSRFILQNVIEGEDCVIHVLQEDDYIVTYNLFNKLRNVPEDQKTLEDEVITYESRCPQDLKIEHTKAVKETIQKILQLDKIYHNCTYVFLFKKGVKQHLLSYSYNESPYPFSMVLYLSEILDLPSINPNWTGKYSTQTLNAFYEDIFVQEK